MKSKYEEYMLTKFPQDLYEQWNKCIEFTNHMKQAFPELTIRWGYVYSYKNLDNYSEKYFKQYPHAWLTTDAGEIIDPSVRQFMLLGELIYVESPHTVFRCNGCGQFQPDDTYYCGKCEWSEDGMISAE